MLKPAHCDAVHPVPAPLMTWPVEREAMPDTADTVIARPDSQSSFVVGIFIVMQLQGFGSWFCIAHPADYRRYLLASVQQIHSRPW
jgi:hypothetical protein